MLFFGWKENNCVLFAVRLMNLSLEKQHICNCILCANQFLIWKIVKLLILCHNVVHYNMILVCFYGVTWSTLSSVLDLVPSLAIDWCVCVSVLCSAVGDIVTVCIYSQICKCFACQIVWQTRSNVQVLSSVKLPAFLIIYYHRCQCTLPHQAK